MKRPSVFLSKSNAGNGEAYRLVKRALEQEGVNIVEYTKGPWDPKHMLACDRLVIVPHELTPGKRIGDKISLGKGQHSQICDWVSHNSLNRDDILIVAEVTDRERVTVEVTEYLDIRLLEVNWTTDYSLMTIDRWATCCFGDCWDEWADFYAKVKPNEDKPVITTGFKPLVIDHSNLIKGTTGNGEEVSIKDIERMFYDPATYNVTVYKWNVKTEGLVRPMLCLAA